MIDQSQTKRILLGLTARAYRVPELETAIITLCGSAPKPHHPDVRKILAECGFVKLMPFWSNEIATNPAASKFADEVWGEYVAEMREKHPDFDKQIENKDWVTKQLEKGGVGTELKKLLNRVGIVPSANCSCNSRAATMNARGIEWCEENFEKIVGWLEEESRSRKLPFVKAIGRLLLKRAIHQARKLSKNNPTHQ